MLHIRILAAISMIFIVFGALYLDREVFRTDLLTAVLLAAIIGICIYELYRIAEKKGLKPAMLTGITAGIFLTLLTYARLNNFNLHILRLNEYSSGWQDVTYLAVVIFIFCIFFIESRARDLALSLENISVTFFGVFYVWFLGSYLLALRHIGGEPGCLYLGANNWLEMGQYVLLTCLAISKSCDIGAYAFGRLFGRIKMSPVISPKKTVEGAVGGLLVSAGVSVALSFSPWAIVNHNQAIVLGLVVGFAAQMGDLAESLLKRSCGVKDSGGIIPGFGGLLDVMDALLVSAPVMYYFLIFISPHSFIVL